MRRVPILVLAVFALSVAPAWGNQSVSIQDSPICTGASYCFVPPATAAASGEKVTWTNNSTHPHNITRCVIGATACPVDGGTGADSWTPSSTLTPLGGTYQHIFTGNGTYVYYCSIHGYAALHGTITVTGGPPPSDTPTASFSVSPATATTGQSLTFDGSASADTDGDVIASYQWTFGDGATQTTSTPTTTHSYASAGSYTASLTVVDVKGHSSSQATQSVVVAGQPVDTPPTASFTFSPGSATVAQSVSFDGSASKDTDSDAIATYKWTFGDGATQTTSGPKTTHSYASVGTVTVTLVVVDSHGRASAASSSALTVTAPTLSKARLSTAKLCARRSRTCKRTTALIRFRLSAADKVAVVVKRGHKTFRHRTINGKAGGNSLSISATGLKPGRYMLVLSPAGGKEVQLQFKVVAG
jgi:PKD repeat protein